MRYRYYLCDVFTGTRFGGNQLAVLPQAAGLSGERMQQVAREFNFSETTFVFPPEEAEHTNKVRIFTRRWRRSPLPGIPISARRSSWRRRVAWVRSTLLSA